MSFRANMIKVRDLSFQLGQKYLLQQIDLDIDRGKFWALVGPNGAGKSTLLNLLARDIQPSAGFICLDEKKLNHYSEVELAKKRAYLLQQRQVEFPFRVLEIVLLGRTPYLNGVKEGEQDRRKALDSLKKLESEQFSDRVYPTLSGGEASRVDMARTITQETDLLLLDEPSNHLDPRHQIRILKLCRTLVAENRLVIAAMHDLNLASLFADQVIMLHQGHIIDVGPPEQVFKASQLEDVYQLPFEILSHSSGRPLVMPC